MEQKLTDAEATKIAAELLPGWRSNGCCWYAPDDQVGCSLFDLNSGAVAGAQLGHWSSAAAFRRACAVALRNYERRQSERRRQPSSNKPASDWSFTASVSNPPNLGRILKEAREHGVKILRVRCGGASACFVWSDLLEEAMPGFEGELVHEEDRGKIKADYVGPFYRQHIGTWKRISAECEASVIAACQRHLDQRREVKVEVLG